jgi:hypothetical protein
VLKPFAALPQVAPHIKLSARVLSASREGFDKVKSAGRDKAPFIVRYEQDGLVQELRARAVIDATGTWNQPNPIGANGLVAIGEAEAADRIFYGIPDVAGPLRGGGMKASARWWWAPATPQRTRCWRWQTLPNNHQARDWHGRFARPPCSVSSAVAMQMLCRLAAHWAHRCGGCATVALLNFSADCALPASNALASNFALPGWTQSNSPSSWTVLTRSSALQASGPTALTGELRLKLDPWLESNEALGPLIDPNLHSCGTVRPHGHRELAHPSRASTRWA